MTWNGNSTYSNGATFFFGAADPKVRSLPWLFRVGIPGFQNGWPPAC